MDAVLLDTNVLSYVIKNHVTARLYDKHLDGKQQTTCFAVIAELLQAAKLRGWQEKNVTALEATLRAITVIPYDMEVCRAWASLSGLKTSTGSDRTFENNDRWIAACAIHHGLPLVTHNRKHFEGIPSLTVISEAPAVT
jgi:tRNA(fMet)-specific endonuclease VapC